MKEALEAIAARLEHDNPKAYAAFVRAMLRPPMFGEVTLTLRDGKLQTVRIAETVSQ